MNRIQNSIIQGMATQSHAKGRKSRWLMGLSRKAVLRSGYGAIMALLVFSSFEAYRIQRAVSDQHLFIYQQFVQRDASTADLRNTISHAGTFIRDFFINTGPESARLLSAQLGKLSRESNQLLKQLRAANYASPVPPNLEYTMREFWRTVEPIPRSMLHAGNAKQYEFLQKEIVPKRTALYGMLRDLKEADQRMLEKNENAFTELHDAAGRRLIFMLGGCLILAFLVAWFTVVYADNLERATEEQFLAVAQAKRDLEQLSARLVEAEERERKRLSRELHDEIGQALAVVQIELSSACADERLPGIRERLARARELTDRTCQTVRNIALLLRPALLDDLGLVPALQWLLEDFMRRSGVACEFSEEGVEEQLPDSIKTCVFRVAQEALHNCEKHANASKLRVSLRQSPGCMRMEVEDNGCGFPVDSKGMPGWKTGLGIMGMRERAVRLGGTLDLDSAPGRGTRLVLTIPVPVTALNSEPAQIPNGVGA